MIEGLIARGEWIGAQARALWDRLPLKTLARLGEIPFRITTAAGDRLFFGGLSAACVLIVGLSLVWPQGEASRSPGPFGRTETITAAARADLARRAARKQKRAEAAAAALQPADRADAAAKAGLRR